MRTTTLILTLLAITTPLFAAPLPNLQHQILEPHNRALSSTSRPSPQHLPAAHVLPINAPHTPSRPTLHHTSPKPPTSDSIWAIFTPRQPCHNQIKAIKSGDIIGTYEFADGHLPKEISRHWSEVRPTEVTRPGSEEEERMWKMMSWRVRNTEVRFTSVVRKWTFVHVVWALSGLLVLAMGVELVALWGEREDLGEDGDGWCGCEQERGDEKEVVREKGMNGYWRAEDEDTDVDVDEDGDLDENGMERSS